jgi:hypothetical protein
MPPLPETDRPPLVRTDFTDDEAWSALREEISEDLVTFVADPAYRDLPARQLAPDDSHHPVLLVADDVTFSNDDRTVLVVDLDEEPGQTFRAMPDAVRTVVGNLVIQNMYFSELRASVDDAGVYRLSPKYHQAMAELLSANQKPGTVSIPGPQRRTGQR